MNNMIHPRSHHPQATGTVSISANTRRSAGQSFSAVKRGPHLVIPICSPVFMSLCKGTKHVCISNTGRIVRSTKKMDLSWTMDSANNEHHHNLGTVATLNVLFLCLPKRNLLTVGLSGKSVLFFYPVGIQLYQWFCLCPINRCIHP